MATSARPSKTARKGPPEPSAARRTPAWGTNARSSPTYSSAGAPPRQQQQQPQQAQTTAPAPAAPQGQPAFPPLAQNQNQSPAPATSSSPAPAAPRDRVLQALSGLTGTTVTILTKTGQRFEGVVGSTTATEGDTTGVTLKDAKDVSTPGAPLKDTLFVAATNIESYTSGPADARPTNGDSFRTDTDISAHKTHPRERDLQAWVPSSNDPSAPLDEDTFSLGAPNANGTTSWDQFTVNEQLFGVKGSFDENVYTTKLDRSAPDFKEREKRAMRIASEIMGSAANNPHIAEERGLVVDDSGANEEDKYGAVVRGQNAYVPPGARRQQAAAAGGSAGAGVTNANAAGNANAPDANAIPKVAVNGPDGSSVPASNGTSKAQSPPSSKAASPSPVPGGVPPAGAGAPKPPADALPAFRDFVKDEKQRLTEKRQALQRGEREKRLADLMSWSKTFKLNKPIPDDLVPILAKDEEKQRLIREKAKQDAADAKAKAIAASTPTTSSRGIGVPGALAPTKGVTGGKPVSSQAVTGGKPGVAGPTASTSQKTLASTTTTSGSNTASNSATATPTQKPLSSGGASGSGSGSGTGSGSGGKKISMFIPPIPPFKGGNKAKVGAAVAGGQGVPGTSAGGAAAGSAGAGGAGAGKNGANGLNTNVGKVASPASPAGGGGNANAANNARLNVNASSFRPNPKASAFSPLTANSPKPGANGALPPSNSVSPKPKSDSTPATPNPFFGTRPIKKSAPVHVKDDFNPFKHNKVVDASQVAAIWPYSGKRYMQMFPQPAHPPAPHPAHMVPPAGVVPGPPIPPPSYEEDSAAQQAAAAAVAVGQQPPQHRGYVYAYPQYGYPPQMMPGMPPPGPPGAYMPGPYMQPMPYPPGMPPPNAMYSPAMGQMPPPQAYMQPPPPGAYPPPPNGAGPRPSMPPTPIPAHAHPYYHQSPQLQHAYPMMMAPPPPNMPPPHGYEGAPAPPPVPMQGGHA